MRPVVLQMGVTLDGFVHGEEGYEDMAAVWPKSTGVYDEGTR